jgi:hypothetical protein
MKHHFKASKIITIQELLELSEDISGSKFFHVELSETTEDKVQNNDLVSVVVNTPEIIDLRIDREN